MRAPGKAYALSVKMVPMTRKSLACLPRLPLELEEEEFDDELAGADEGAEEDEPGCWLG